MGVLYRGRPALLLLKHTHTNIQQRHQSVEILERLLYDNQVISVQ